MFSISYVRNYCLNSLCWLYCYVLLRFSTLTLGKFSRQLQGRIPHSWRCESGIRVRLWNNVGGCSVIDFRRSMIWEFGSVTQESNFLTTHTRVISQLDGAHVDLEVINHLNNNCVFFCLLVVSISLCNVRIKGGILFNASYI